jgi:hypothetical protein
MLLSRLVDEGTKKVIHEHKMKQRAVMHAIEEKVNDNDYAESTPHAPSRKVQIKVDSDSSQAQENQYSRLSSKSKDKGAAHTAGRD